MASTSTLRMTSVLRGATRSARAMAVRATATATATTARQRLLSTRTASPFPPPLPLRHRLVLAGGVAATALLVLGYAATTKTGHADVGQARGAPTLIGMDEVERHSSPEHGIWVVIAGQVYDVTEFVARHPGGDRVIYKHAGQDVTPVYEPVHPSTALSDSVAEGVVRHVGQLDAATVKQTAPEQQSEREQRRRAAVAHLPPLEGLLCLDDFERVAHATLTDQAWAYYTSAADDEVTKHNNRSAYSRVWFRPRVLRAVGEVDASTTLLGHPVALPVYIAPAAMAKLGHPDGELNLTRAAGDAGIVQGISANASVALQEMLDARRHGQALVYQLYVNRDRAASERILRTLDEQPRGSIAAVMLTVDAPVMGNRESDTRAKGEVVQTAGGHGGKPGVGGGGGGGVGVAISGYIDPNLTWDIIDWYRAHCRLPLVLKGVQSVDDVALAVKHGCTAVVLSNHGGRSLEYSPAPMDVLIELREQRPELLEQIDVLIDGGVRRGTDVLKAMALGAKGVGLGRPFLYAQSNYGQAGAARAIAILREEIERGMRLLGITSLSQLTPDMIDILPRSFDPYLLHRQQERRREYIFEQEQADNI